MAHRVDILELLQRLVRSYPGQTLQEASIELYIDQLADLPLWLLHQAAQKHIRQSRWFPRISELYSLAAEISNWPEDADPDPPGAGELLQKAHELKRAYYRQDIFVESEWWAVIKAYGEIAYEDSAARLRRDLNNIQGEIETGQ